MTLKSYLHAITLSGKITNEDLFINNASIKKIVVPYE